MNTLLFLLLPSNIACKESSLHISISFSTSSSFQLVAIFKSAMGGESGQGKRFIKRFTFILQWKLFRKRFRTEAILVPFGNRTVRKRCVHTMVQNSSRTLKTVLKLQCERSMTQLKGFTVSGKEHKLKRSLYGLKQAPRCWNTALDQHLKRMGFKQTQSDYTQVQKKGYS